MTTIEELRKFAGNPNVYFIGERNVLVNIIAVGKVRVFYARIDPSNYKVLNEFTGRIVDLLPVLTRRQNKIVRYGSYNGPWNSLMQISQTASKRPESNLKLTYDEDTRELIAAEVIK